MREVHHRKSLSVGCLGLATIRRDEQVGLIDERTAYVEGIERPQRVTFEASDRLFEGIL